MRTWLFYKATSAEGRTNVEFRRVENGHIFVNLPANLRGIVQLSNEGDLDRSVQRLVRSAGWVGDSARPANSEVGRIILQGRW